VRRPAGQPQARQAAARLGIRRPLNCLVTRVCAGVSC
jgi:hypothetical protein